MRASVFRAASAALDVIAGQLRAPYEARANAIMYRHILADLAHTRDWKVHLYEAKQAETQAAGILADRHVGRRLSRKSAPSTIPTPR